jgi:hypothetical protein
MKTVQSEMLLDNSNNKLKVKVFYIDNTFLLNKEINEFFDNTNCIIHKMDYFNERLFIYYENI